MADNENANPSAEAEGAQAGSEAEGSSEGGFSEAFAERAAQSEKPPETAAAPAAAPEGQPAEQAGATEAPSKEAAKPVAETKAPAFDPYAGLTPEQKAHFERLAASERSNRGRVGALTKKLNGVVGTQAPPATTESSRTGDGEGAGSSAPAGEGKTATDIEARLKAVTEEYGDIVGPLAEVINDVRKEIGELKASASRHEVDQDAAQLTEAYAALESAHPDYQQVAADPKFHSWLQGQPSGVQALANSYDPAEVSLSLKLFKAESAAASAVTTDAGEGAGSTATGDRRERQLDGLKQAPDRGAPVAAGVPNDFSSAFKARVAQHQTR